MEVKYINHTGQELVLSEWPIMLSDPEKLVGADWTPATSTNGKVYYFGKEGQEKEALVQIFADSEIEYKELLDSITSITDKDAIALKPGKLVIGDYYLMCFIVGWTYEGFEEDFYSVDKKIKIRAEQWKWERKDKIRYTGLENKDESDTQIDTDIKGYSYDYDYDYAASPGNFSTLNNEHFGSCDFLMNIHGYAVSPSIVINGHEYKVNKTVQENEVLAINSKDKTIILSKDNNIKENCFTLRHRDSYIFQKIPAGESEIYWNGDFIVEIILFEERSEPRWTSSIPTPTE